MNVTSAILGTNKRKKERSRDFLIKNPRKKSFVFGHTSALILVIQVH